MSTIKESNIFFKTNTYEIKRSFKANVGDSDFFRHVMDYDALIKLRRFMGNTFNSRYYIANAKQVEVVGSLDFGMVQFRDTDEKILEENRRNDLEYGYPENNDFHPLLDEIIIDDKEMSYADEMLGKWEQSSKDSVDASGNRFGLFIKQKIKRDLSEETVSPQEAGFEEIEDTDPYYYIYRETATRQENNVINVDKARLYEEKYGSIFRAFKEVQQEEIIQAPVNQLSFVNAGPGTGKTYTLMKKITYMIDELGVDPESILVLCFTNAAVNEIKARIKKYAETEGDRTFINVDVRTFHSFSWLLINQANEVFYDRSNYSYVDISQLNYDQSIRVAARIIRTFGDEVFGECKHLVVDEIQDLTNERASLVISMVKECIKNNVGITILGDSCQAIYDYSEDEYDYVIKSDYFYKCLFAELFERGKFYKLEKNHRQNEWLKNITLPLRKNILDNKKLNVHDTIVSLNDDVPEIDTGALSTKISQIRLNKMTEAGTVCLMCRNNAQVLATSTNLRKRGIKHIVNAYNEFEFLADWIGKVFALYSKEAISYDEFSKQLKKVSKRTDSMDIWERLQDVIGSKNNIFRKEDILSVIAKSKLDDPVFRNIPSGRLYVSNIHKAKGREYDTVVLEKKFVRRLMTDKMLLKEKSQYIEESKMLYVAVTRPKSNLYFNSLATADVSLKKIKTGRKRWVRGDGSNLKNVEIRALSDANVQSFKSIDTQNYIINNVSEGDEIKLALNTRGMSVSYDIVHIGPKGEFVIGSVSDEFIEDIDAIITPYNSPWPRRITDLYVSGIRPFITNDYKSVWCWVDFCGLGVAHTDMY